MKPEDTVDFPIRWIWHRISRMYNNEALKHDLTMSVGYVLLNIDVERGTPSTKLGPKMGMEPRSLTRTLKTMEAKGLIVRRPDPVDKRKVRICLTRVGIQKRKISKDTVLRFNHLIQEHVPEKKLEVFFEVIGKVNELLENENAFKKETA